METHSMPKVFLCTVLFAVSCSGPADVGSQATAPVTRSIDFSKSPDPVTVQSDGVEVTLAPMKEEYGIDVSAAIRMSGMQPIIVQEGFSSSEYFERWLAIGKLSSSDTYPSILLTGFTGGAHCCATLRAIVADAGKLKILDFEAVDGEPGNEFPKDLDGDGTADFIRQDDSFRYQFASGAGSFSPPVILNIYKGQIVDVSDQPGFRPIWEKYSREMLDLCSDRSNPDRNGACAAYVAASARLGRFASAMEDIETLANNQSGIILPTGCSVKATRLRGQRLTGDSPVDSTLTFGGGVGRADRAFRRGMGNHRHLAAL